MSRYPIHSGQASWGLHHDAATGVLSGTPLYTGRATLYTYTIADSHDDSATLTFTISVVADTALRFGNAAIANQSYYVEDATVYALVLPQATGGRSSLTYSLNPLLPSGFNFDTATRTISGTPAAVHDTTTYTYIATDGDDTATLTFTITVTIWPTFQLSWFRTHLNSPGLTREQLEAATEIDLSFRRITEIPDNIFAGLTALENLNLSGNSLRTLPTNIFDDLTALRELRLHGTSLIKLPGNIFGRLTRLTVLNLGSNALESLSDNVFSRLPVLQDLDLGSNRLRALPGDIFSGLGNLSRLSLFSNKLRNLPQNIFRGLPLNDLILHGNHLNLSLTNFAYWGFDLARWGLDADNLPDANALRFRGNNIAGQTYHYVQGFQIARLYLPWATGGNTALSYSLIGNLPDGLSFSPLTYGGTVSGTPMVIQTATTYTYIVTDADKDTATLTFAIAVTSDVMLSFADSIANQNYVAGITIDELTLPESSGGNSPLIYSFDPSDLPNGLNLNPTTGIISGTPTTTHDEITYTYAVTDVDGDTATLIFSITIAVDKIPGFEDESIANKNYTQNIGIAAIILPEATGGDEPLGYSLTPALPTGLNFTPNTRMLSGTPTAIQPQTTYTYNATDGDTRNNLPDTATLTFTITIVADKIPHFDGETIADKSYKQNIGIAAVILPEAADGNAPLSYSLTPALPTGLNFIPNTRLLSGTPTEARGEKTYTYTATDSGTDNKAPDPATLTFTITVVANRVPNFGGNTIDDKNYIHNTSIAAAILPEATGGDEPLGYSLTPALPTGLRFTPNTRILSGTPTAAQAETTYTYIATDSDTNAPPPDTATLTFTITVNSLPTFGLQRIPDRSYIAGTTINLPLPLAIGGDGALTYSLNPTPPDGITYYASDTLLPALRGTPTEVQEATSYTYTATDIDGDFATLTFTIKVEADSVPTFAGKSIPNQSYTEGIAVTLSLPRATGGNIPLSYSFSRDLPTGLSFDSSNRMISGTPATVQETISNDYTYIVTDGNKDTDTLTFTITIAVDKMPGFDDASIDDKNYKQNTPIAIITLPTATGGDGDLTYTLVNLPTGLNFNPTERILSGTPTEAQEAIQYTYIATDSDTHDNTNANGNPPDSATLTFTITIAADKVPNFDGKTIDDKSYKQHVAMNPVILPEAAGGDGALNYRLSPALPADLRFTPTTRVLSGTPTVAKAETTYTYTATDSDTDGNSPDSATLTFTLTVVQNSVPTFGDETIEDRQYTQNEFLFSFHLPAATGGDGQLTYSLNPPPPDGIIFNNDTEDLIFHRTLGGNFNAAQETTRYTYTATDADGDAATLTFTMTVEADTAPDFGDESIADQRYITGTAITLSLPAATGGNRDLTYLIRAPLPNGLSFNPTDRNISGTPTRAQATTPYTYFAHDEDRDSATLTFTITVIADSIPTLPPIPNQIYIEGTAITLPLPRARGGNGDLTYALTDLAELPDGLSFNRTNRTISGTPTGVQDAIAYTYTVTDIDEDSATRTFTITIAGVLVFNEADFPTDDNTRVVYTFEANALSAYTLPTAVGGLAPVHYRLTDLGSFATYNIAFDAATRVLRGEPSVIGLGVGDEITSGNLIYTATDSLASPQHVNVIFTIAITATFTTTIAGGLMFNEADFPTDGNAKIMYTFEANASNAYTLPAATGGLGPVRYRLTGLEKLESFTAYDIAFDAATRVLIGEPHVIGIGGSGEITSGTLTYTATDSLASRQHANVIFTIAITMPTTTPTPI